MLLFIYVEVMGMIRVYLLNEEIRITYPLIIAITAISRLIILQKKDLDPAILIYESVAILILAFAIIVASIGVSIMAFGNTFLGSINGLIFGLASATGFSIFFFIISMASKKYLFLKILWCFFL